MCSSPILTCYYLQSLRFSIQKAFTFQYSLTDLGIKFFHFSHLCLLSLIYWLHFIYSTTTRFYCSDKPSIFFVCHVGLFHKSNNSIKWGTVFLQIYDHIKIMSGMNFFRICHPDLNSEPVETPYSDTGTQRGFHSIQCYKDTVGHIFLHSIILLFFHSFI